MQFTLQATGLADLVVSTKPYGVFEFDPGSPAPRDVIEDYPDADGEIDTTAHEGARVVTLGVEIVPQTFALVQALKAFTHPRLRPTLLIELDGAPTRRAVGRLVPFGDPFNDQLFQASRREVVVQMRVPSGVLESAEQSTETIFPGAGSASGLEFGTTLEFGATLEFPLVDPPGTAEVVNAGDRDAYPVARLFGPFGDEGNASDETTIENVTSGDSLVFAGMGVVAGDYVEIDFRAKTILLNGGSTSKYSYLKFPDSAWWTLLPGTNELAFRPDTFSGNAQLEVLWRSAYS